MAGRMYTVVISGTATTAATITDLMELNPASTKPIRIRRIRMGQLSEPTTEEEQLALTIYRAHTTSGSGGSAPTPIPLTTGVAAAGFTAERMNTTVATAGSPVILLEDVWNTRAGVDLAFSAEEAPGAVNERLVVRQSATADAVTLYATFWIEELG
jgi:hypothetical protein